MSGTGNVGGFDPTTATSYIPLSSSQFLKTKEEKKLSNSKIDKPKRFRDVIKEAFVKDSSNDFANTKLTEEQLIAQMQDEVYATGDALSEAVSTENILAYKKAVKNFLEYVLEKTYNVENIITGTRDLKRKKAWTIVKVINTKLDKLISDLMYNQLKKLEILERVGEIKGLIVDLRG